MHTVYGARRRDPATARESVEVVSRLARLAGGGAHPGEAAADAEPERAVVRTERLAWWVGARARAVIRLRRPETSSRFVRLATAGAVGLSVLLPMIELGRIATYPAPVGPIVPAAIATACYLPLHLRHVLYALHGARPVGAGWTLAAMGVVIIGATPLVGVGWLFMFSPLAVSVLILVRLPWSFLVCVGLAGAMAPLALALGEPGWSATYYPIQVVWRAATLFVLVWLVAAARQLQAARLALTDEAVFRERLQIEGELRATVADALARIAAQGEQAGEQAGRAPALARDGLQALVEGSRHALAEARRISSSYQQGSLHTELDVAVALLGAAGIETRLVLPTGDLSETVDESMRSTLRAATARLLSDDTIRHCIISVTREAGQLQLEVRGQGRKPETMEATA
jgi:two-component system sensor histidine kinase DesK